MRALTIVILSYNQLEFLIEAIKSCFVGDFDDYEIIIVDDASKKIEFDKDRILNHINLLNHSLIDIRIVVNERNYGTVKSLNKVIPLISSTFFTVVSGDDLLVLNGIKKTMKVALEQRLDLVGGNIKSLDEKGLVKDFMNEPFNSEEFNLLTAEKKYKYIANNKLPFSRGGALYRLSKVIEVGFFDDKYDLYDDRPMYLRLAYGDATFAKLDETVYIWRNYSGTSTNGNSQLSFRFLRDQITLFTKEYLKNAELIEIDKSELKIIIRNHQLLLILKENKRRIIKLIFFSISNLSYILKSVYRKIINIFIS